MSCAARPKIRALRAKDHLILGSVTSANHSTAHTAARHTIAVYTDVMTVESLLVGVNFKT